MDIFWTFLIKPLNDMIARLTSLIRTHGLYFCLSLMYFGLVAIVLRYPTSTDLSLVPLDPNFPLHALAALDLSDGGSGFVNTRLSFLMGHLSVIWLGLFCSALYCLRILYTP